MEKIIYLNKAWGIIGIFLFVACSSGPNEVGIFIKTSNDWVHLKPYEYDWMGGKGFVKTENLTHDLLPTAKVGAKIRIHKVSLDPTAIYFGRNAQPYYKNGRWEYERDSEPVSVKTIDEDFEISTTGLPSGSYSLWYIDKDSWQPKAYFFRLE